MNIKALISAVALANLSLVGLSHAADGIDPAIPAYTKVTGVSGNITSMGSDSMANVMTLWAEEFKKQYPGVAVQIQAAGSSTAAPALVQGTANFGPMSRPMKDEEIAGFEKKFGYKPTAIPVAIDALAVFVNKDNPLKGLTMKQVDAIFSANRACGGDKNITKWGDLGLTGAWASRDIQLYGRNSVSGTYGYFKEHALCKGDFKANVNEQPGSASVVQSVSGSVNAIGYSGIGYVTSSVHALPLAKADGAPFVQATKENALNQSYPLSRALYIYVNKAPGKELGLVEREFLKLVLSKQGQEVVVKDGFIPLPNGLVQKALASIK